MKVLLKTQLKTLFAFALLTLLTGCSEYWWSRGQTPDVSELLSRAQSKLTESRKANKEERETFARLSESVESGFMNALTALEKGGSQKVVTTSLTVAQNAFLKLEGNLSMGSRPAYGELLSQLSGLLDSVEAGKKLEYDAVGLLTARSLSFLANELSVPAPVTNTTGSLASKQISQPHYLEFFNKAFNRLYL